MIRLSANLTFLFTELPFLDRFEAAARAGFRAVEFAWAFDTATWEIAARLKDHNLSLVMINTPPGDTAVGELGLAVLPGREDDHDAAFEKALEYAVALDAPLIHLLSGNAPPEATSESIDALFIENLARSSDLAAKAGRTLMLEALNKRTRPGYYMRTNAQARRLIVESGRQNVKLQLDLFHTQITEGDLVCSIERNFDLLAHVQIASVPDRAEPDSGEIAYPYVLKRLDALGYAGFVGAEYHPAADTLSGLGWARPYLHSANSN